MRVKEAYLAIVMADPVYPSELRPFIKKQVDFFKGFL